MNSRVRASWRARACAAGLSVGAQIFLFGAGIALPVAMNAAWIASLAALPFAALVTHVSARSLACSGRAGRTPPFLYVLLALTLLANAAFAVASLVGFAGQTLLTQSQAVWSAAMSAAAVFLCALSGGTGCSRLCFALRFALPVSLTVLMAASVPMRMPVGLFPLLGAGAGPLLAASLCMPGAASAGLMLLLPPPELSEKDAAQPPCSGFFLRRMLAGGGTGAALLFAACVCTTYESIAETDVWGARLHVFVSDMPREGALQTLLLLLQMMAIVLLAVNMLCAAEQALCRAWPALGRARAGLCLMSVLLFAALYALVAFGFAPALFTAPWLVLPTALLLGFSGKLGASAG